MSVRLDMHSEMAAPFAPHHRGASPSAWRYWQWFILRSAGFPVEGLERLRIVEAADAADRLISRERDAARARQGAIAALSRTEGATIEERRALIECSRRVRAGKRPRAHEHAAVRARVPELTEWITAEEAVEAASRGFASAWAPGLRGAQRALRELISEESLREAILWQSREASVGIEALVGDGLPAERNHRVRERERLASMYLQRFLAKNDQIGYFGPSAVGHLVASPSRLEAGPSLVKTREAFFEHWAMVLVAHAVAADPEAAPHLRPRRSPSTFIDGNVLHYPIDRTMELPAACARLLHLCDGSRSIRELEVALCEGTDPAFRSPSELEATLVSLEECFVLTRVPLVPVLEVRADRTLYAELERILPAPVSARWLKELDELDALRSALEQARGVAAVQAASSALDDRFQALTGASARRGAGGTYAARSVAYIDCLRDVAVELCPEFLARLAPLELVYDTIRAYTARLWETLAPQFDALHRELAQGTGEVDFLRFLSVAAERFLTRARGEELLAEFQRAWHEALALVPGERRIERSAVELRRRLGTLLEAGAPGWPSARFHSPDLMLAAHSPEAIKRGAFVVVIGEIHPSANGVLYPNVLKLEPDVLAAATRAYADDLAAVVRPALPGSLFHRAVHYVPPECPALTLLDISWPPPNPARARVLPVGELVVAADVEGRLFVSTRDGSVRLPFRTTVDSYLIGSAPESFKLLQGAHVPRVTVDGAVLWRESWRIPSPTAGGRDDAAVFLAVRRWAREHGLPRRVFVKSAGESKPFLVDFDNPFLVEALAHISSKVECVDISEMLPVPEDTWLPDAAGRRYTCELRMCVVDPTALMADQQPP